MKIKFSAILAVLLILTLTVGIFAACDSNEQSLEGLVIVTFELNGGTLHNNSTDVLGRLYHGYKPNSYVIDISNYMSNELTKKGFVFEGWYRDENCTVPWNFATDCVTQDITLYAKWETEIVYRYVVYMVVDGEQTELGTYRVAQGDKFNDSLNYGRNLRRYTRTFLGYYSDPELETAWDNDYTHPGGEESTDIPVYVDSIEGVWQFVNNYETLLSALRTSDDIYLTDDVDCGNNVVAFAGNNGIFNRVLQGNGYTISNLSIGAPTSTLYPTYSVFGTLGASAKILNVHFTNIRFTLVDFPDSSELQLGALAVSANSGAEVRDVTVSGTYTDNLQFLQFTAQQIETLLGKAIYDDYDDTKITVTGFESSFTPA